MPEVLRDILGGREDKEACDRHTAAWSKMEWRRKTVDREKSNSGKNQAGDLKETIKRHSD